VAAPATARHSLPNIAEVARIMEHAAADDAYRDVVEYEG
jgi:hypothetical protein